MRLALSTGTHFTCFHHHLIYMLSSRYLDIQEIFSRLSYKLLLLLQLGQGREESLQRPHLHSRCSGLHAKSMGLANLTLLQLCTWIMIVAVCSRVTSMLCGAMLPNSLFPEKWVPRQSQNCRDFCLWMIQPGCQRFFPP